MTARGERDGNIEAANGERVDTAQPTGEMAGPDSKSAGTRQPEPWVAATPASRNETATAIVPTACAPSATAGRRQADSLKFCAALWGFYSGPFTAAASTRCGCGAGSCSDGLRLILVITHWYCE